MAAAFSGFDHIDARVASLALVEAFYDKLMAALGLTDKRYVMVRGDEWDYGDGSTPYNAVEYLEAPVVGKVAHFIGIIEEPATQLTMTRIAFRVGSIADVERYARELPSYGALHVELSADMRAYPAVFFEDPGGTKLELCARPATYPQERNILDMPKR